MQKVIENHIHRPTPFHTTHFNANMHRESFAPSVSYQKVQTYDIPFDDKYNKALVKGMNLFRANVM